MDDSTASVMQQLVASSSPDSWRDALVVSSSDGRLELALLDGSSRVVAHDGRIALASGTPVGLHPLAGVLADGRRRLDVRVIG